MLQYLIILLDDTSVSFCHYHNTKTEKSLIPLDVLRDGILFAMKENLQIQFVLPEYPLPYDYWSEIMKIDSIFIVSGNFDFEESIPLKVIYQYPDVVVFDNVDNLLNYSGKNQQSYVLRICKTELSSNIEKIASILPDISRLNIILTDIETFTDDDFQEYDRCLGILSKALEETYLKGLMPQLNVLTDRIMLKEMNNCDAAVNSITLAPNGRFYICPAFYQSDSDNPICEGYSIGCLENGLNIKNASLYKLNYAPLCRECDAYQCKRCIWLNYKTTYEVNTPSHEQCVIAHLERNASRQLLLDIREQTPSFLEDINIKEINYLDPFDVRKEL